MDTDFLKTFLEVNRTRHFGKAADNLYVTQSTVSARIRQLEESVGAALFIRNRNDIQLTAAGQRLLVYAESITTTWNRARQEIAVEEDSITPIAIAGVASLWDISLQKWLHATYRKYPDLSLNIEITLATVMTRGLLDGTLDLAFMFEVPQLSRLEAREIARIPLILVSTENHNTVDDALANQYVLVDWGTSFASAHARHFPSARAPSLRLNQGRVARDFIVECGGAAYLAAPMVQDQLEKGLLHQVTEAPVIERTAHAVYSSDTLKQPVINNLLNYFIQ